MPPPATLHPEAADSLALALVAASTAPLLLLDADLTVIAASATFCQAFEVDPAAVAGRSLAELGNGDWGAPKLASLLNATARGLAEVDAYDLDLVRKGRPDRGLVLNARKLDLAVLFDLPMGASQSVQAARRWSVLPLIEEDIFLISARSTRAKKFPQSLRMSQLCDEPLILPTGPHGLRSGLNAAFSRAKVDPRVIMEMDSLAMLMDAVSAGLGSTLQPWAAVARMQQLLQGCRHGEERRAHAERGLRQHAEGAQGAQLRSGRARGVRARGEE